MKASQNARQANAAQRSEAIAAGKGKDAGRDGNAAQKASRGKNQEAVFAAWLERRRKDQKGVGMFDSWLQARLADGDTPDKWLCAWLKSFRERFFAAQVATGEWTKDHPEAVALTEEIGTGTFSSLQNDLLAIRKTCNISNDLRPEMAEFMATDDLVHDAHQRDKGAELEEYQAALIAAEEAVRKFKKLREHFWIQTGFSDVLNAEIAEVKRIVGVFYPGRGKRPRLASSKAESEEAVEEPRKVFAKRVGGRLYWLGLSREAAAAYLRSRGYETAEHSIALANQATREIGPRLFEPRT